MALRLRDAFASLILGILAVLAWPVTPWSVTSTYDVTITATGTKNERSTASEVWLSGLPTGIDMAELAETRSSPQGWEQRGAEIVSYQDQPSTIHFSGELAGDGAFTFRRHDWSGVVTIEVNGVSRSEDLFDDDASASARTVALSEFPVVSRVVWNDWGRFLSLAALWSMTIFAMFVLLRSVSRGAQAPPVTGYAGDALRYALPALAIFLLVLLGTWPAQMSPDSVSQWAELETGDFSNAHPIVHTLLVGGPGYLLGSPGWSMTLQILLLALACGALAAEVRRWGISPLGAWAIAALVPALPAVHLLSTVFWKDVPYGTAIGFLTAMLMALIRTGGAAARRGTFVAGFIILLFLIATLRHNGLLVSAGILVLLGLVMGRELKARFVIAGVIAAVALPLAWTAVLMPALGINGVGRHYAGAVPLHLLGRMVAENRITDTETLRRLDKILPLEAWKSGYNCLSVVPLFWASGIKYDKIDETLFIPAIHAALENPMAALAHVVCVNSSIWRLSPPQDAIYTLVPLGIWKPPPPLDRFNLAEAPVVPMLNNAIKEEFAATTASPTAFMLFWRPAFLWLAIAASMALLLDGERRKSVLLVAAPTILNSLSLIPFALAQDFRYQYVLYITGPVLILLAVASAQNAVDVRSSVRQWSRR